MSQSSNSLWKVVHIDIPEGLGIPVDPGYAVAYRNVIAVAGTNQNCLVIPIRYCGFMMYDHALKQCNTLNIYKLGKYAKELGETYLLNSKFAYDVV